MCTLTFLPLAGKLLITSNRDEHTLRAPALAPQQYEYKTGNILFPKDGQAGGTWLAMHQNGNVMILLNGAFGRHEHKPPYRLSRGIIFLQIFDTADPKTAFEDIDLDGIEPFTLVIWQRGSLWETKWDGHDKFIIPHDAGQPHIWSSAMLYDPEVIAKREEWFSEWLAANPRPDAADIRCFHEFGGEDDERTALRMNLDGILLTVSITGLELTPGKCLMHYKDMVTGEIAVTEMTEK